MRALSQCAAHCLPDLANPEITLNLFIADGIRCMDGRRGHEAAPRIIRPAPFKACLIASSSALPRLLSSGSLPKCSSAMASGAFSYMKLIPMNLRFD